MALTTPSRADLHCHSSASELAKLGVQRALGLPECATDPEEAYALAKRRGMDFVTLTDHDTITGALALADRPDTFVSEELTARFRGEPRAAVHILCYGITPDDHDALLIRAGDIERVAAYLHAKEIACALAHPFYAVDVPLLPRHRRVLAELFAVWETRNGARARELNAPAAVYVETHGGTGVGGSDDHAGVTLGQTWTETPAAPTPAAFLTHLRTGRAEPGGAHGSAAKWTHAAVALAARVLGGEEEPSAPDPRAVLTLVQRILSEGDARGGALGSDLKPSDARALLRAWLVSVGLAASEDELLAHLQAPGFDHAELFRRARRVHERRLGVAIDRAVAGAGEGRLDPAAVAGELFAACLPVVPYAPSTAFLAREKARLAPREGEPRRVALVADGIGQMHGVTHILDEIRERGVPGFEVEVIGTDPSVDRRLSAVREVEIPFYAGLRVGVPSLPAVVEALAEGSYDLVHVSSPGPSGVAAALLAGACDLPLVGSYHTELAAYAGLRTGDARLEAATTAALAAFYGPCRAVLSPSPAADASLAALGIGTERIDRWERGVDLARFSPGLRDADALPGEVSVLYAGRLTREKGVDLLAEAFLAARRRDPRLHLVLAGGGPEQGALAARLGEHATFLGWLEGEALARAYASADVFLFCSRTDTYGQVILEAQASGLPVVAVDEGGPRHLVEPSRTGLLCPPDAEALGAAVAGLAAVPGRRTLLARAALAEVRGRTWARALGQLAAGYRRALAGAGSGVTEQRAA